MKKANYDKVAVRRHTLKLCRQMLDRIVVGRPGDFAVPETWKRMTQLFCNDWELLRYQKRQLVRMAMAEKEDPNYLKRVRALDGLIGFLDEFQDTAEELGFKVFPKNK